MVCASAAFTSALGPHILRLLLKPAMAIDVEFLPLYTPSAEEASDAATMAEGVRRQICAASGLPPNPVGAKELRKEAKDASAAKRAAKAAKQA